MIDISYSKMTDTMFFHPFVAYFFKLKMALEEIGMIQCILLKISNFQQCLLTKNNKKNKLGSAMISLVAMVWVCFFRQISVLVKVLACDY